MLKYFFLIIFLSYFAISKPTNFDIQDSLIKISVKEILQNIKSENNSVNVIVQSHSADWLINQNITNQLIKNNYKINDSADISIELFVKKIEPEYSFANGDTISRSIDFVIAYRFIENDEIRLSDEISHNYKDYVKYEDLEYLENKSYIFTHGNKPDMPASFWEQYVEPVIVISAAIVTVIIFFTVRSG